MAGVEIGLSIAFYFYPCAVLLTLFFSQLIWYRYREVGNDVTVDVKRADKAERLYAKLIWSLQLLLTPLLVLCF